MKRTLTAFLCFLLAGSFLFGWVRTSSALAAAEETVSTPCADSRSDIPAILVDGPAVIYPGDKIYLRVPRVLEALYGVMSLSGLELMSSSPRGSLLYMPDGTHRLVLGSWCDYAELAFRVTAPAGSTVTFRVSNVSVMDSGTDRRTSDIVWTSTVALAIEIPTDMEGLEVIPGSHYSVIRRDGQLYVMGASLEAGGRRPSSKELCAQFTPYRDAHLLVVGPDGRYLAEDELVCTGDRIRLITDRHYVYWEAAVVVHGDVLGSGELSLSQVTRLASALRGTEPLEGAYLCAGDWSGTGTIGVSDLVRETGLFRVL